MAGRGVVGVAGPDAVGGAARANTELVNPAGMTMVAYPLFLSIWASAFVSVVTSRASLVET